MKKISFSAFFSICLGAVVCIQAQDIALPQKLEGTIPFDRHTLGDAPKFRWENRKDSVRSLYFEGAPFKGRPTEVFAYYAIPATFGGKRERNKKFPAIVLIHGGGGTAFAIWAREWAKRGYAAIAMDLAGARPWPENEQETPWSTKSDPLPNGAPDDTQQYKFFNIDKAFGQQWQYHAVSNIIRAHSLIRSLKDVDASRTAVTGISWGGYLTNIVAGIDHRFKAAVPIYGCGFLAEKSTWLAQFDSLGISASKKWIALWEPSRYVGNAKMPMLFINGTNDFAYPVESWQKTVDLAQNGAQLLIHGMKHNHEKGAAPKEIHAFVDQSLHGSPSIPHIGTPAKIGKWVEARMETDHKIKTVSFIYTNDTGKNKERKWNITEAKATGSHLVVETDGDYKLGYFLVTYANDRRISSPIILN